MLRKTIIRSAIGLALSLTILATRASAQTGTTLDKANMQPFFANMGYDVQKLGDAI